MSQIIQPELIDALGTIHDIIVGLVAEKVFLYRGTTTRNVYDEEVSTFGEPEIIDAYIKYPELPRIYPGVFYDEEELPIIARIKNSDLVKQGDVLLVSLRSLSRIPEWKKYVVIDLLTKVVTNMEVYAKYKLSPDRSARDFWITDGCTTEDFDGDLSTNWDIIESDYTVDTVDKHSGTQSIKGGTTTGALLQSKTAYRGLKYNVWVLLTGAGQYLTRFNVVDTLNYYELVCEDDGGFVKYSLFKVINGVATLVTSETTTVSVSDWINITVEIVNECNKEQNTIRVYLADTAHTEEFVVEDTTNPIGAGLETKFQIGIKDSNMDGEMVFCNLYHIE